MSDATANNALRCRNCGYDLSNTPFAKFCAECGQETDPRPPTFAEFTKQFFGNYIAVKGSLLQTLWRLISRPGALTKDYWEGRKRQHVLPLRLYLTVSVISFLIFGLLSAAANFESELDKAGPEAYSGSWSLIGDRMKITFKGGDVTCTEVPQWLCDRARQKYGSPEKIKLALQSLPERMVRYWAYAMLFLVPALAVLLKLVYVRRRRTFGEHTVFSLHIHTFLLLSVLLSIAHPIGAGIAAFAIPIYALIALKRSYNGGWIKTIIKAAFLFFSYMIAASIAIAFVAIAAFVI